MRLQGMCHKSRGRIQSNLNLRALQVDGVGRPCSSRRLVFGMPRSELMEDMSGTRREFQGRTNSFGMFLRMSTRILPEFTQFCDLTENFVKICNRFGKVCQIFADFAESSSPWVLFSGTYSRKRRPSPSLESCIPPADEDTRLSVASIVSFTWETNMQRNVYEHLRNVSQMCRKIHRESQPFPKCRQHRVKIPKKY